MCLFCLVFINTSTRWCRSAWQNYTSYIFNHSSNWRNLAIANRLCHSSAHKVAMVNFQGRGSFTQESTHIGHWWWEFFTGGDIFSLRIMAMDSQPCNQILIPLRSCLVSVSGKSKENCSDASGKVPLRRRAWPCPQTREYTMLKGTFTATKNLLHIFQIS